MTTTETETPQEPSETLFIVNWMAMSAFLENGGRLEVEAISKSKAQSIARGKRLVAAIQPVNFIRFGLAVDPSLVSAEIKKQLCIEAGHDSPLVVNDGALIGEYMPLTEGTEIMLAELYVAEHKMIQPKSTALKRAVPGRKELQVSFGIGFFLVRAEAVCPALPRLEIVGD